MSDDGYCKCGEELASVTVSTDDGTVKVGKRCAGLLEMIWTLAGGKAKRRPILDVLRGSVE